MIWRVIVLVLLLPTLAVSAKEEFEPVTLHTAAVGTATGSTVGVSNYGTIGVDVTISSGTATVNFEGRASTTQTFQAVRCLQIATGTVDTSATASGTYQCPIAGLAEVRMPVASCAGCTVVVTGRLSSSAIAAFPASAGGSFDGILRDGTGDTTQANVSSGRLQVDGSGVTQPVSGSVTVTQGTGTNLHMVCDSGCSSSAGFADNSAFTYGTTAVNPIAGVLDDVATNAATENSAAVARITAQKALHANLRNASGTEIGTAGAPIRTDPTGSTTQPVSGTFWQATQPVSGTVTVTDGAGALNVIVDSSALPSGASTLAEQQTQTTSLQLIDDTVHASDAVISKHNLIGCQFDDVAPGTTTENNTRAVRCSTRRELYGQIRDAAGNERGANVNASNQLSVSVDNTVTVGSHAVTNAGTFAVQSAQSGTWTVQPGNTANTTPWLESVCDTAGTNCAAVKAASTAAVATDKAVVVAISPNNTVAATQSGTWNVGTVTTLPALPANQSVNVAQVNGVATSTGVGAAGTGTQRVVDVASGTTGAAPPTQAAYVGGLTSGATGGFLSGFAVCDSYVNVNVSTATTTLLVSGVSGRHVRICGLSLVTAAANNVALLSGTGATCGTGTTGMSGGTTAASGWNFSANSGLSQGNGLGTINQTNATGDSVCIVTSAATQLSGRIAYAIY